MDAVVESDPKGVARAVPVLQVHVPVDGLEGLLWHPCSQDQVDVVVEEVGRDLDHHLIRPLSVPLQLLPVVFPRNSIRCTLAF